MEFAGNIKLSHVLADLGRTNTEIIRVDLETSVEELAALLQKHNILSVPVYDKKINDYVGIVDCFELLKFTTLADYFKNQIFLPLGNEKDRRPAFKESDFEEFVYSIATVGEIINTSERSRHFHVFHESELLENAMRIMGAGSHRILVRLNSNTNSDLATLLAAKRDEPQEKETTEESNKEDVPIEVTELESHQPQTQLLTTEEILSSVPVPAYQYLSQTDIVNYLAKHEKQIDGNLNATIDELGIVNPFSNISAVVSVPIFAKAIEAFIIMSQQNVQAVALVDQDEKLITNISASDLRGITGSKLKNLLLPVTEYIEAMSGKKPTHPVSCTPKELLKDVMLQILAARVHRSWVVDSAEKPIGVVTMSDCIGAAVGHLKKYTPYAVSK